MRGRIEYRVWCDEEGCSNSYDDVGISSIHVKKLAELNAGWQRDPETGETRCSEHRVALSPS